MTTTPDLKEMAHQALTEGKYLLASLVAEAPNTHRPIDWQLEHQMI